MTAARPRPLTPSMRNVIWVYNFAFNACANGQKLKCLTIIDEYTRKSSAIDVADSFRPALAGELLSRLLRQHGALQFLRSGNGREFVSRDVLQSGSDARIDTAHIELGKR